MTLEETLEKIHPADKTAMEAALAHWNNIAMPLHSLGRLQDTVVRIAGMTGNARVDLKKKALVVMCADNGVVEEGVTQSGQEVTKIVAENFLKEKATASILCKKAADPSGAYCGSSSGYPFISAWNLYLAWNNGSVPGAGTCENISASERTGAWYVCQCGKRGFRGEHADRSTFFRCLHRLRKSTSSGALGWRSSESDRIPI